MQADPDDIEAVSARLHVVIGRLVRTLRRAGTADIGAGSLAALATLARSGPMRLGDLAAREGVSPPTLTRIIAALEESGYVRRKPDPDDRRAVVVTITDHGEQVVGGLGSARVALLRARLEAVPAEDLRTLVAALAVLEQIARDDG